MIAVIIAGGSGTRLWPLSTPEYPKHLLKIGGDSNSLLQNTYNRVKSLAETVYVVSEAGHIQHVKDQLSELPENNFIVEPGRRGTANCIALSLVAIGLRHDSQETVVFVHADHFIRDEVGFAYSFSLANTVANSENKIVLVGVEPDYPATGFGYIQKGNAVNNQTHAYEVQSFKEKPDFNTAKQYLASGKYLWNCGYFLGSINIFKSEMEQYAPELFANYQALAEIGEGDISDKYLSLENMAIDYALIEKVPDLLVVPASFDWMDLGSFADIAKASGGDELGNLTTGKVELEEVQNSLVQNTEDKPLAVIGLDNIVVVNTPSGILVARKDLAQKVGDVSKRFNNI